MRPLSPGEFLQKEFLSREDLTIIQAASMMHLSPATLRAVIRGTKVVGPRLALRLASATGTLPECWLALQAQTDSRLPNPPPRRTRSGDQQRAKGVG